LGTGESPAGVAVICIGKELEAAAADSALEVVFYDVGRPLRIEEILERAGALCHNENALLDDEDQLAGEFQILARLIKAQTLHEAVALWAGRHWNSLTLCRWR